MPARVNKIEREFAGKDLVNSYGVVERFVKKFLIASTSITLTKKAMASNLMFVMSNLDNRGDGTSPGTPNWIQISLYSNIIRSEEVNKFTICSCLNKITNTQQYYIRKG